LRILSPIIYLLISPKIGGKFGKNKIKFRDKFSKNKKVGDKIYQKNKVWEQKV